MNKKKRNLLRNLLLSTLLVAFVAGIQACTDPPDVGGNFLAKPPSEGVNQDSIFSNPDYARRFLMHTYSLLPYGPYDPQEDDGGYFNRSMLASLTDINQDYMTVSSAFNNYYSGSYSASGAGGSTNRYNYDRPWNAIRNAYIFIENIDRVPGIDDQEKGRLKAEAQMIIALFYTDYFRNYGGMPWVDHAYGPNEDFQLPRMTAKATLDSTLALINRAIPNLPFALDNPATESGRFTQAAAMGLKARMLLFAASPLFNSNEPYMQGEAADKKLVWFGGYDANLWQRAADAAKALIDKAEQTGAYYLLDTGHPRQDFQDAYYDRESPEVLISVRQRYKTPESYPGGYFYNALLSQGAGPITDNYVRMFPMADGTPIDKSSGYDPHHPYENRDPRLYETVLINGDKYQGRTVESWIGGRERKTKGASQIATGYRIRKFVLDGVSAFGTVTQWPELRLPEIYLSYAEALNEVNQGPTPEAYKYVNKVRNRVDLDDLPAGLSQEEFRNAVLQERALELGFEDVRLYDMIRWKRDDIFKKNLYGINICKKGESPSGACDGSYGSNQYIYNRFELPARYWQDNWSPKWYLSAFPQNEVLKGYGIIQNPGWKL